MVKRQINKVRTDTLENKIAHYRAMGWDERADAIRDLAFQIGAPIDIDLIAREVVRRKAVYYEHSREEV